VKHRVGVDVDGVLADLLTPCLRIAGEMLGKELTVDHMQGWDLDCLFPDEQVLDAFWKRIGEPGVCRNLEPYPEAVAGVAALREVADVYIVTSYLHDAPQWVHERDQWVQEHFGIPRSKMVHTKAKYTFAGKMLVDDKPQNIQEWAAEHEKGIPVLWEQPYNSSHVFSGSVDYRVVRAQDWGKLVGLVSKRSHRCQCGLEVGDSPCPVHDCPGCRQSTSDCECPK
jgi:5'(3')-deoxyribonucleotidase